MKLNRSSAFLAFRTLLFLGVMSSLFMLSRDRFLVFHTITELLTSVILLGTFLFAWNLKEFENGYLKTVGISLGAVGTLQVFHTMSYKGLSLFPDFDANLPTLLWLGSRFMLAASLAVAPFFSQTRRHTEILAVYGVATGFLLYLVFGNHLPVAFNEQTGLTSFKIYGEYLICLLFAVAILTLRMKRDRFDPQVYRLLLCSLVLSIGTELIFTLYTAVTDTWNAIGHLLSLTSVYLFYLAILKTGIAKPYALLLRHEQNRADEITAAFNSLLTGIIIYDRQGGILRMNSPARRMLPGTFPGIRMTLRERYSRYQFRTREGALLPIESFPPFQALHGQTTPGAVVQIQRDERSANDTIWVNISAGPIQDADGEVIGAITALTDITELHQAQEKLREAVNARDDVPSIATHELKTPITALSLNLQLANRLLGRTAAQNPEVERVIKLIQSADGSSRRLAKLVNDLLDLTRIRAGVLVLHPEKTDLASLTREIVDREGRAATAVGSSIELISSGPVIGFWDPSRLDQIVTNLVSNAIKYGEGKPIQVRITNHGDSALLSIADQGGGIAPEMQEKIFQRFERVNADRKINGLGLGLFIVRKIIEAHGGPSQWTAGSATAPPSKSAYRFKLRLLQASRRKFDGSRTLSCGTVLALALIADHAIGHFDNVLPDLIVDFRPGEPRSDIVNRRLKRQKPEPVAMPAISDRRHRPAVSQKTVRIEAMECSIHFRHPRSRNHALRKFGDIGGNAVHEPMHERLLSRSGVHVLQNQDELFHRLLLVSHPNKIGRKVLALLGVSNRELAVPPEYRAIEPKVRRSGVNQRLLAGSVFRREAGPLGNTRRFVFRQDSGRKIMHSRPTFMTVNTKSFLILRMIDRATGIEHPNALIPTS